MRSLASRRITGLVGLVAVGAIALTACGGGSSSTESSAAPASSAAAPASSAAASARRQGDRGNGDDADDRRQATARCCLHVSSSGLHQADRDRPAHGVATLSNSRVTR